MIYHFFIHIKLSVFNLGQPKIKNKSILEGFQYTTSVVVLSTDCTGSWDVSPYPIGTSGTKIWYPRTDLFKTREDTFNVQKVVIFVMIYHFFIHIKLSVFNLGQWHAYMSYVYLAKLGDDLNSSVHKILLIWQKWRKKWHFIDQTKF
jgi:hypothetical protein